MTPTRTYRAATRLHDIVVRRGAWLVWVPAVVVLAFGIVLLASVQRGMRDLETILTMQEAGSTAERLLSRLLEGESATRGFYLTGDSAYLRPYQGVAAEIQSGLGELRSLSLEPEQRARVETLTETARERLDVLNENLAAVGEDQFDAGDLVSGLDRGQRIMEEVRVLTSAIAERQRGLLASRAATARRRSAMSVLLIVLGTILVIGLTVSVETVFSGYARLQRSNAERIEEQNRLLQEQAGELEERLGVQEQQRVELERTRADLEATNERLRVAMEDTARSESRLRALVEHSAEVVLITDDRARIRYESPAVERVLGYRPDERIGRDAFENVHPEDVRRIRRSFVRTRRGEDELTRVEFRAARRDGSYAILSATIVNMTDNPAVGGIVANLLDVSELRSSEDKLRHAQKMEAIGRLAGGVAHDFNNILMVIRGSVDMALETARPGHPLNGELDEIATAADRGAALSRQLLTISRNAVVEQRVIDINEVIRDIGKLLRRSLGEDIDLVMKLATDLGRVRMEPGQVEQILMNLAINSRDAMPRGGSLIAETRNVRVEELGGLDPGEYVLLSVSDNGVGMSREVRERVFEPFFTTKPPGQGTGLGLSTVYGIVRRTGGHIWVYSEPGHGTTFRIYLPLVRGAESQPRRQTHPVVSGTGRILVVEDERAVRSITSRMVARLGFEVFEAASAEEALEVAERLDGGLDGIISDVVLPTMPGPELVGRLRDRWPHLRILFASGYTDHAMARYGVFDNGASFIQKPYQMDELATKLAELFPGGA